MALSSGNFPIYIHNNQFYFNTEDLLSYSSGDMPIFLNGSNVSYSEINLYSAGQANASGTLSTVIPTGLHVETSNLSLYIDNRVPDSGNIGVFSRGLEEASGDINLWHNGSIKATDDIPICSFGAYLESEITVNTYSRGVEFFPIYTIGGVEGRKWGESTSALSIFSENVQSSGSEYIIGDTVDLYIDGATPTEYSIDFPIYTRVDSGFSSGVFPITINSKTLKYNSGHLGLYSNSTSSVDVIGGLYESLGIFQMGYYGGNIISAQSFWKDSSGVLPIYTETSERAMLDLYTKCGPFGSSGDITSYSIGAYNSSGDIGVYISSDNFERSGDIPIYLEAKSCATISLYTYNYAENSGDISIFSNGVIDTKIGYNPLYLYGNGVENTSMSLYFHGF